MSDWDQHVTMNSAELAAHDEDVRRAERARIRAWLFGLTSYPMESAVGPVLGYPDFAVWALLVDPAPLATQDD